MGMTYTYEISPMLISLRNGEITKEEWDKAGKPCVAVSWSSRNAGKFTMSFWDLLTDDDVRDAGTDEISIDDWSEDDLITRFEEFLNIENYVENNFLSREDGDTSYKTIKRASEEINREDSADKMSELLMDTDWGTWKMFEELCSEYLNGNADTRKAINSTLAILTGHDLGTIASELLEEKEKRDDE